MSEEHDNVVRSHESGPLLPNEYANLFFTGWWFHGAWNDKWYPVWSKLTMRFWVSSSAVQDMVSKLSRKE